MPARKKAAAKRKVKAAPKKSKASMKKTGRAKVTSVSCACVCHRTLGGKLVCPKCFITFCSNLNSR